MRTGAGGAGEFFILAKDFGRASGRVARALGEVYVQTGESFRDAWRQNAVQTAGEAGKHYPNSIESTPRIRLGLEVEVGPNPALPQGGMSFEFGSSKQPPHLDGARAMPAAEALLERRADTVIGLLVP